MGAAEYITAIATVVLAVITAIYAWETKRILDESAKMRKAAEKQAEAASATLEHLREQIESLDELARTIVLATIDRLRRSIDDWKQLDIKNRYRGVIKFPSPDDLVPSDDQEILKQAARVSRTCAHLLNDAFGDLCSARDRLRDLIKDRETDAVRFYSVDKYDPDQFLASALEKLELAGKDVMRRLVMPKEVRREPHVG